MDNGLTAGEMPDTEARILQAAEREFMVKGFAGARTTTIAEGAGVTHAMLHYYFRTKEKLFDRIITDKMNMVKTAFADVVNSKELTLKEAIWCIIDRHLSFFAENPDLPRFLIGELYNGSERSGIIADRIRAFATPLMEVLQKLIDAAADRGECRRVDAEMLMLDIVSLNAFAYVATPVVNAALNNCMADGKAFLVRRKKENYDTIMRKIAP